MALPEQDIGLLDDYVAELPSDIRQDLAERGRNDLYFFNKAVLKMHDLTPNCHGPLCVMADKNPKKYKLFLMPRDHLKSSCLTIGAGMQRVVKNPESRQLIANESSTNSNRFLRSIRQHAESNRVFRALYSGHIHKDTRRVRWNDSELDFVREGHYPEPTIDSIGMTGAVTSRHYTHITYDDPISEEAVKSELVMQDTINRMSAAISLLVNPETDTIWLVGTRWALHDVYTVWMKTFGDRMAKIIRAAIEDDEPIWPERFSFDTLTLKREQLGEYKFSCLMMNNPRNEDLQDMNIKDLRFWRWSDAAQDHLEIFDANGDSQRIVRRDELDVTCCVDLAAAEKTTSDRNAITTVGVTKFNEALILEAWGKRCTPLAVIEKLLDTKQRWNPRAFGIEDVFYQKAFKYVLSQACRQAGVYMNIKPMKAQGKKEIRIRGLQPLMATGRLYALPSMHILRNEISDFPLGEHDDVLDSLSMHLQLFRGNMAPGRWEKYKKSEAELIRMIQRGAVASPETRRQGKRIYIPDADEVEAFEEAQQQQMFERTARSVSI